MAVLGKVGASGPWKISTAVEMPTLANVIGHWIAQASDLTSTTPPLDDTDAINQWDDDTSSLAATQATGSKQPTWDLTNTTVALDGGDVLDHASFPAMRNPFTVTIFTRCDSAAAIRGVMEIDARSAIYRATDGTPNFSIVSAIDFAFPLGSWALNTWIAHSFVGTDDGGGGTNIVLWQDGVEIQTVNEAFTIGVGTQTIHLGSYDAFSLGFAGDIKRLIFQTEAVADATIVQMHDHFLGTV